MWAERTGRGRVGTQRVIQKDAHLITGVCQPPLHTSEARVKYLAFWNNSVPLDEIVLSLSHSLPSFHPSFVSFFFLSLFSFLHFLLPSFPTSSPPSLHFFFLFFLPSISSFFSSCLSVIFLFLSVFPSWGLFIAFVRLILEFWGFFWSVCVGVWV